MNVDNGHLMRMDSFEEFKNMNELGMTPVPKSMAPLAEEELGGEKEKIVDLYSASNMAEYAKIMRSTEGMPRAFRRRGIKEIRKRVRQQIRDSKC